MPAPHAILDRLTLNRTLLLRQGLLARVRRPVPAMLEHLVGLQAQEPSDPYLALANRLEDFDPATLSALLEEGRAVRLPLLRGTLHLVTAADALALQPLTHGVLGRQFRSQFARTLGDADLGAVVTAGRELLAGGTALTRAELGARLAPRWPDVPPSSLGHAVVHHLHLLQVPPRGLWQRSGQARWTLTEEHLGVGVPPADLETLVLRYLRAFGPARTPDIRTWSSITGLKAVVQRLRPALVTYRDDAGRELLDLPDGAFAEPGTPAPPRFLPEYDNVTLSHADRGRMRAGVGPGQPSPAGRWIGALLADGAFRAWWTITEDAREGAATLTVDRFTPRRGDPPNLEDDIRAEGERLLELVAPDTDVRATIFTRG